MADSVVSDNAVLSTADNLVGGVIAFGVALMLITLMALVAGEFVDQVPEEGAYSEAINSTTSSGETGFIIFGTVLLFAPVVALIAYLYSNGLGGFVSNNR